MADLTKFIFNSDYSAFKNNDVITGTFTIDGTYNPGVTTKTFSFDLGTTPDLVDVQFSAVTTQSRFEGFEFPANSWIRAGGAVVPASSGAATDILFMVSPEIVGGVITFRCFGVTTDDPGGNLVSTTVSWRVVDYSVF